MRPLDIHSVRYPALARIGNNGEIIPTVYTYGRWCGPYLIPAWDYDVQAHSIPSNFYAYDCEMWHIMAEMKFALFIFPMDASHFCIMLDDGSVIMYCSKDGTEQPMPVHGKINLPGLCCVGFLRTCPKYLAPWILPYHLYADTAKGILYVGNSMEEYSGSMDVYDVPPLTLYKALIDADADYVVSNKGVPAVFKKGGR